jgi:hypothetical protein
MTLTFGDAIMSFDLEKSLEELEGKETKINSIPENFASSLIKNCLDLYKKPLNLFTIEDLRIMIGQNIGLQYLIPLAITQLEENPFASGDFFYGDLLITILRIDVNFWRENPDSFWRVFEIAHGLISPLETMILEIKRFEKHELLNPKN